MKVAAVPLHPPVPAYLHLSETPLPNPGPALAVCAHDLVELGAWMLAANGASLLTVTLCAEQRDAAMPIVLWNAELTPDAAASRAILAPTYRFRAVAKAVETAADALFAVLRPRWPAAAPPAGLGVMTDGTGLGFCPDDPSPLAPGWVGRQLRDPARLTCLLPFGADGAWPMMTSMSRVNRYVLPG